FSSTSFQYGRAWGPPDCCIEDTVSSFFFFLMSFTDTPLLPVAWAFWSGRFGELGLQRKGSMRVAVSSFFIFLVSFLWERVRRRGLRGHGSGVGGKRGGNIPHIARLLGRLSLRPAALSRVPPNKRSGLRCRVISHHTTLTTH